MNIEEARTNMLKQQLRARDVLDEQTLGVIEGTPREFFVPELYQQLAYSSMQIPLAHDQVMMAPEDEGIMIQSLGLTHTERILEIGTGTGYITALLAELGQEVVSVDIFPEFTERAGEKLKALGLSNVNLVTGDGARGWEQGGPFDVIVITGSLPSLPRFFQQNLKEEGRLYVILGVSPAKKVTLIRRAGKDVWSYERLAETKIPELIGASPAEFNF